MIIAISLIRHFFQKDKAIELLNRGLPDSKCEINAWQQYCCGLQAALLRTDKSGF